MELEQIGDIKQFKGSASRMVGSNYCSCYIILLTLIVMFGNIKISLMILFSIPLPLLGASWTMLGHKYHVSMACMMGFMASILGLFVTNGNTPNSLLAMRKIRAGILPNKRVMV